MNNSYTMSFPNLTQALDFYFCPFALKKENVTNAVYFNLVLSATINSAMIPFTILFNAFLVFIIFRNRNLKKKMSNVAIGYLAITDLAVGAVVQPMFVAAELCRISGKYKTCLLDTLLWYTVTVICRSAISHLVVITWERYVAVKHALRYEDIVTRWRLSKGIAAAWFIPIILEVILLLRINPLFSVVISCMHFIFCVSMFVYFYKTIYMEARRHRCHIEATTPHCYIDKGPLQEFKATKTTAIIVSCVTFCYAVCIFATISKSFIFPLNLSNSSTWACISSWQNTLIYVNSLIKPLIYGWREREIKEIGKKTWLATANRHSQVVKPNEIKLEVGSTKTKEENNSNDTGCSQSQTMTIKEDSCTTRTDNK